MNALSGLSNGGVVVPSSNILGVAAIGHCVEVVNKRTGNATVGYGLCTTNTH